MRASTSALLAAFVSTASAVIFVTSPVATTSCSAGTSCTVSWNDDGNAPVLATIGVCSIELCTGGVQQQTCLQTINPAIDVSSNSFVPFIPDATIGGNGNMWFVKFVSAAAKDATNPQFPYTAYSAKFTLSGMTGTFNSTIQAEINGAATGVAVAASPLATSSVSSSSVQAAVGAKASPTSSHAANAATTAKPSTASSGAAGVTAPGVVSGVTGAGFFMTFFGAFLGMLAFGL